MFFVKKLKFAIAALMATVVGLSPNMGRADTQSPKDANVADDWYLYVLEEGTYNKWHEKEVFKDADGTLPEGCYKEYDKEGDLHYYVHEYEKDADGNVKNFPCWKVVKAIKGLHKEGDTSSYSFGSLEMTDTQFFCISKDAGVDKFERDEEVGPTKYPVQTAETSTITDPNGISHEIAATGTVYYCGKTYADTHVKLPYSVVVFKPGADSKGTLCMKKPIFLEYTTRTSAGMYNDAFHEEFETYDGETWTISTAQFTANDHCTITYNTSQDVYESHEELTAESSGQKKEIKSTNGFAFTKNCVCSLEVKYLETVAGVEHFDMTYTKLPIDNSYYLVTLKKNGTKYTVTGSREFEKTEDKVFNGVTYTNVYALPGNILMDKDAYFAISGFVPSNSVKQKKLTTISEYGKVVDITTAVGVRNHCKFDASYYGTMYIVPTDDAHVFKAYFEKKPVRDAALNGDNIGAVNGFPMLDQYVTDKDKGLKADVPDGNGGLTFRPILHQNPDFKDKSYTIDGKEVKLRYFDNRIALTGSGCSVNRLVGGALANVATASTDIYNIISPAIDKAGSLTNGIGVSLATAPLVSVRDKNHYYAKGTTAGFSVIAGSGTKVLSLSVINMMSIAFYRDGNLMAVLPVDAQTGEAVKLSLISISNDESSYDMTATAPCVFDEVAIFMAGGVELNVGDNFQVKYAFVGNSPELTLGTNGLAAYNAKVSEKDKIYVEEYSTTYDAAGIAAGKDFVGDETTPANIINTANLILGGVGWARACVDYVNPDNHLTGDVFKKGDRVSFKIKGGSLLELGLGTGSTITLYRRYTSGSKTTNDYKVWYDKCYDMVLNATVLDLGVVEVKADQTISMEAPCDFSGMKLTINDGLVNLGETSAYYASVTPAPTVPHECDIKLPADVYLHKTVKETYYWLKETDGRVPDPEHKGNNPEITEEVPTFTPDASKVPADVKLTWTLTKKPSGSGADCDPATGKLTGLDLTGDYVLSYTVANTNPAGTVSHDGCSRSITVHYMAEQTEKDADALLGGSNTAKMLTTTGSDYSYSKKVVNSDDMVETVTVYRQVPPVKISVEAHTSSGGIIIGQEGMKGLDNIIDGNYDTYATIKPTVSLIENAFITGVKTTDGSNMIQSGTAPAATQAARKAESTNVGSGSGTEITEYNPVRVGFLVQCTTDGVDLSALDFFNIRAYKNGKEVDGGVIEQSTGVDAGIGDTEKEKIVRYSRVIPRDKVAEAGGIDEFALWLSGVADIKLSEIRVYGAFIEELDSSDKSHLPSMCSNKHIVTDGSVYPKVSGGAVDAASTIDNLSFLTDYDPDFKTAMTVAPAVGVGNGQVIEVKLAETVPANQQVAVVVDDATFALGATVGDWLKVRCLNEGVQVGEDYTDWGILGAKIGSGDSESNKAALVFTPTGEFDELQLEVAGIVNALDTQEFYGICTQGDANGDGVPDCIDTNYMVLREDVTREITTGIESVETSERGAIRIETWGDGTATVSSEDDSIDEVTVYDLLGTRHSIVSAAGGHEVTLALPYEICIVSVELTDGYRKTFKIRR